MSVHTHHNLTVSGALTDDDETESAPGDSNADLMRISDEPEMLLSPTYVPTKQFWVKLTRGHGADGGEDDHVGFTTCESCEEEEDEHITRNYFLVYQIQHDSGASTIVEPVKIVELVQYMQLSQ